MTSDLPTPAEVKLSVFERILFFRGPVGKKLFFIGIAGEAALILVALAAASGLTNPTGGGSAFIAFIFLIAALWWHFGLVTGRMRDAGAPVFLGIVLTIAAFAWPVLMLEFIESLWAVVLGVFLLLYLAPGFFKSKASAELPKP
ncbi:MAG TPA: hypothetical protein PKB01_01615 [Xanthobacteraceae bacterium]|nr:hypothetical protein [Xanthobacteraceae bacterium]